METLSADLTRFDFHVNRFLDSEDVRQMTAEEVGQYILLLCEAWRLHKGASLPNNQTYLNHVARSASVSPNVMKKFDLVSVEGGESRFRNKRLFEEWNKALNRYQKFSSAARKTNEKRWGSESLGDSPGQSQATAIPYHSNPTHPTPDQINASIEAGIRAAKEAEEEEERRREEDL